MTTVGVFCLYSLCFLGMIEAVKAINCIIGGRNSQKLRKGKAKTILYNKYVGTNIISIYNPAVKLLA